MNKLVKDALILTAITLIAGLLLGLVYEITKAPIAKANEEATQRAYMAVFESASSFSDMSTFSEAKAASVLEASGYKDGEINNCVVAYDASGNALGYVVTVTTHAGYGGDIVLSVGITNDGTLNGYSITSISETAGLGMNAKNPAFYSQFEGIPATGSLTVTKSGKLSSNEIDAISGATITSRAVTGAVNAATNYFYSIVGEV